MWTVRQIQDRASSHPRFHLAVNLLERNYLTCFKYGLCVPWSLKESWNQHRLVCSDSDSLGLQVRKRSCKKVSVLVPIAAAPSLLGQTEKMRAVVPFHLVEVQQSRHLVTLGEFPLIALDSGKSGSRSPAHVLGNFGGCQSLLGAQAPKGRRQPTPPHGRRLARSHVDPRSSPLLQCSDRSAPMLPKILARNIDPLEILADKNNTGVSRTPLPGVTSTP